MPLCCVVYLCLCASWMLMRTLSIEMSITMRPLGSRCACVHLKECVLPCLSACWDADRPAFYIYLYVLFPKPWHLSRRDKTSHVPDPRHLSRHDMTFGSASQRKRSARCARDQKKKFGFQLSKMDVNLETIAIKTIKFPTFQANRFRRTAKTSLK